MILTNDFELLSIEQAAKKLNLKVNKYGRCPKLEKCCDPGYCRMKRMRIIPHYFKGANMKFKAKDIDNILNNWNGF